MDRRAATQYSGLFAMGVATYGLYRYTQKRRTPEPVDTSDYDPQATESEVIATDGELQEPERPDTDTGEASA